MKNSVLLVCAVMTMTFARARPLVKFELIESGFGPTSRLLSRGETPPAVLPFSILDIGAGVATDRCLGVAVGTAMLDGNLMWDISYLPVRLHLLYDFGPDHRWRQGALSLSATYVHSGQDGWTGSQFSPYVKVAGGASYRFYVVSAHAELAYDFHWRMATFTARLGLGGLYVFR